MKKIDWSKHLTIISPILLVIIMYLWMPDNTASLSTFFSEHTLLGPILLILWRITSIVIPPIPGGIISIAMIPVFGWFASFLYATIGVLIGCCVAFLLARRYREKVVKRFISLQQIHQWESKLSQNQEFWAFVMIRFTTGPVMDFMSYIAGLSKISFQKFFVVTLITLLPDALYYYAGDKIYQQSPTLAIVSLLIFVGVFYALENKPAFEKLTQYYKSLKTRRSGKNSSRSK
jgi:uncharacterized membrane protein YdjX (TVP38/TMEM64 family)